MLEFRLTYRGPLPSEKCRDNSVTGGGGIGRATDKQRLRKYFHPQMRELWRQHPNLRYQAEALYTKTSSGRIVEVNSAWPGAARTWVEHIADDHQRCGGRFVPLVSESGGFTCALDILFLRRDNPGNVIETGGDIDNRIKVLLDGLRMPKTTPELGGFALDSDEDPFYCLLEDDRLITKVSVTTDRLLTPQEREEKIHDVNLIVHVTVSDPSALFAAGRLV